MALELTGTIACSAGASYFHVYPNGDVYRCQADYNARRAPMFNVARDGWPGAPAPSLCDHERCANACDLDWTTKWQLDAEGRVLATIEGQRKDIETEVSRWLCSQRFDAPQRQMAYFTWLPTLACNYTCAYCGCAAGEKQIKRDFPSSHPELSVDTWLRVWGDILDRFDYGILSVTGGEPLLSAATAPVLGLVSQKFACYVTSNVSRDVLAFTRSGIRPGAPREAPGFGVVPTGLSGINCSLHPTSKGFNWELFKGAVLLLRNAGFHTSVNFVGYPLQLYLAPDYKAWCDAHAIPFTLSSWQGTDNDGTVARYSPPERSFFEALAPAHRQQANELVFGDCRYEVTLDAAVTRALMADVVTFTGRVQNRSAREWHVGSGPGRWCVAAYITRVGRPNEWLRQVRTSPADTVVLENGTLEFALPIDTRGLPAGSYVVWIDLVTGEADWMGRRGAEPAATPLNVEPFSHEIKVDTEAMTLSPGRAETLRGTLRKTCGTPWPAGDGGEPLRLGARLFRRASQGPAVREFRAFLQAPLDALREAVGFSLLVDPDGLPRGSYDLSLDVVKEHQFWLAEKGTTPKIIPVVIA